MCQARCFPLSIMEIYGQGKQQSLAQIPPERFELFYQVLVSGVLPLSMADKRNTPSEVNFRGGIYCLAPVNEKPTDLPAVLSWSGNREIAEEAVRTCGAPVQGQFSALFFFAVSTHITALRTVSTPTAPDAAYRAVCHIGVTATTVASPMFIAFVRVTE